MDKPLQEFLDRAQEKANIENRTIYVVEDYVDGYFMARDDDDFDFKDVYRAFNPQRN